MPGKRKGSHRKEKIYALKRRGSVRCPRCKEDIFRGPRSNPVDELFIRRHQARDQNCREMPVPAIVVAAEEFRDDDMNDHVNFEADRFDYNDDDFDARDGEIDFRLDQPGVSLDHFHDGIEQLDASRDFDIGTVQLEENQDLRERRMNATDVYMLKASEEILKIQREHLRLFEDREIIKKFKKIRTPKGKIHKKKWEDLIDIYGYGTTKGMSRDDKNDLLEMMNGINERNGIADHVTIPKDWKSLDALFTSSYESLFEKKTFEYDLPKDFFGEFEADGETPLRKMVGYALDVKRVLAEALLGIDPDHFSTTYRRDNGILDGFESGDVFQKISEDDKLFYPDPEHPEYGHPISLCLSIRSDETTCNSSRTEKEMAIVISILNAKSPHYKMLFLGYVPIHMPYSDPILHDLLIERGIFLCLLFINT